MRLIAVQLQHINQFDHLAVRLQSRQSKLPISLFLANQNAGKSNLLKQIFHGLSWLPARYKDLRSAGAIMPDSDIQTDALQAQIQITIEYPAELLPKPDDSQVQQDNSQDKQSEQPLEKPTEQSSAKAPSTRPQCHWTIKKIRSTPSSIALSRADTNGLDALIPQYQKLMESDPYFSLPCLAYYPSERFVHEVNLNIKNTQSALTPIHQAYDQVSLSFTTFNKFFEWLREVHDLENAQSAQLLRQYLDPQTRLADQAQFDELFSQLEHAYRLTPQRCLNSLRSAIHTVMPEIEDIFIEYQPKLRLMVKYQGQIMPFLQLSQTKKTCCALVGDIVRRLCTLNPNSLFPCLEGDGIVLIDDIDAHLDLTHRQQILQRLHRAFPRVQFIATATHSDMVEFQSDVECFELKYAQAHRLDLSAHQQRLAQVYQSLQAQNSNIENENNELAEKLPNENDVEVAESQSIEPLDFAQLIALIHNLAPSMQQQLLQSLQDQSINPDP